MGTLSTKKLETVYHIPEKMQQKKSLVFLTVEECPSYLGTSGKNTHSNLKHFFALPAMRPGDSQGGGFSAAPLEPASYQFSCRDKKIAPGGTRAGNFCEFGNITQSPLLLTHVGTVPISGGFFNRQKKHRTFALCFWTITSGREYR